MSEIETEMKMVEVDMMCDACGKGRMEWNGIALTSYPAQYPHRCTECGHTKTYRGHHYPYTKYVKIRPDQ